MPFAEVHYSEPGSGGVVHFILVNQHKLSACAAGASCLVLEPVVRWKEFGLWS